MHISKKDMNIKEFFLLISFSIYLFVIFFIQNSMLNFDFGDIVPIIKNLFLIFCVLYCIFFNRYTLKELSIIVLISIPLIVTRLYTGNSPLLDLLIIVCALKSISLRNILKTFFCIQTVSFIMILVLNFFTIIPDRIIIRDGVVRKSLGFWHPNSVGLMLVSIFLLSLFLIENNKRKILAIVFFNIISIYIYQATNSRTTFILILVSSFLTIINMLFSNYKYYFLKLKLFIPGVYIFLVLFSIISIKLFTKGNELMIELSQLMSHRLSIGARFLEEYGVTLFGSKVEYYSPNFSTQVERYFNYNILDNVYLKYLINFGVISIVFLGIYLILISLKLKTKKLIYWNLYLLIFLIYGISEQSAFNMTTNFFMLYGVVLFQSDKNNEFIK